MRYVLLTVIIIQLLVKPLTAQINLNLALNSRPQPWLADWQNPVNGQMIITYLPGPVLNDPAIKLKTTLLDERGNVIGASDLGSARIYTLRPGVNQFSIADALQFQNLLLPGRVQDLLQRTGRLAAGQYQLKVEVFNRSADIVRTSQSKPFSITSYQLPVLLQPAKDVVLDAQLAQNTLIFRWTNLVPGSPEMPQYRIQVFEILPGQNSMQAYRGNRPVLDETVRKGMTQFIWRPSLPMLDSTANYNFIWTIMTLDSRGNPIPSLDMNTQGRSEPSIFKIRNRKEIIEKIKENRD